MESGSGAEGNDMTVLNGQPIKMHRRAEAQVDRFPPHEYANLFPIMNENELKALISDIRVNGLREPVVVYQDTLLDGRHRRIACERIGVELTWVEYEGDDPLGYVLSKNLHRRHLSESQRAMVAAKLANLVPGDNQHTEEVRPIGPTSEMLNVSERSVKRARAVRDKGVPELVEAVEQGAMPVSVAEKVAREDEEEQREILKAKDPMTEIKKRKRRKILETLEQKATALPSGRVYSVIYADPPWSWKTYSEAGKDRTPENHYPLLDAGDIVNLDFPVAKDAVLFMWTTAPHFETALKVIPAWGFAYKTNIIWFKDRMGTGYWVRNKHEHLLIATRGIIPAPSMGDQCMSVIEAAVGKHSAKPDAFREIIISYYPDLTKLELFARGEAPDGWDFWGKETVR